jgi:hypothetical protein
MPWRLEPQFYRNGPERFVQLKSLRLNGQRCVYYTSSCREVWRCVSLGVAIKFSFADYTHGQSQREHVRWRRIRTTSYRKYFAPVHTLIKRVRYWAIVQTWVEAFAGDWDAFEIWQGRKVTKVSARFGIKDVWGSNWVYSKEQVPVIVDYGG